MRKRGWLIAGLGAALIAIAAIGVSFAQDGGADGNPTLLDRIAGKLGIDTPKLEQAIHDARSDEIDARVARGDLTQEQADRLKERLDKLPADAPFGFGPWAHDGGPHGGGSHFKGGVLGTEKGQLAEFLGIDEAQLRQELSADGATLAKVAEAHGKSRDDLKGFIVAQAKERLDEAVSDGRIDQARADEVLAKVQSGLDALIDGTKPRLEMPRFRWGRHPGHMMPGGAPNDSPSKTPGGDSSFRS